MREAQRRREREDEREDEPEGDAVVPARRRGQGDYRCWIDERILCPAASSTSIRVEIMRRAITM